MDLTTQQAGEAEADSPMEEDTPTVPTEQSSMAEEEQSRQQPTDDFRMKVENVPPFIGTSQMKKFLQT